MIRPMMTLEFATPLDGTALAALQQCLQQSFAITASIATNPASNHLHLFAGRHEPTQVADFYFGCKKASPKAKQLIETFGITALSCADDTHNRARLLFTPTATYGSRATPTPPAAQ